jgi:predicted outer membrane repeat protein
VINSASGFIGGAGLANISPGDASLTNVTFGSNSSGLANGGGVYTNGKLALTNVTANENAGGLGGNLRIGAGGVASLRNTLLASPISGGNCSVTGTGVTLGGNLSSDASCGLPAPELNNANPLLGPLSSSAGTTPVYTPLFGSPAIDRGVNTGCPATDQRGAARPIDGDGNGTLVCDIGAVEYSGAFGKGIAPSAPKVSPDSTSETPVALPSTAGTDEPASPSPPAIKSGQHSSASTSRMSQQPITNSGQPAPAPAPVTLPDGQPSALPGGTAPLKGR